MRNIKGTIFTYDITDKFKEKSIKGECWIFYNRKKYGITQVFNNFPQKGLAFEVNLTEDFINKILASKKNPNQLK